MRLVRESLMAFGVYMLTLPCHTGEAMHVWERCGVGWLVLSGNRL